MLTNEISFGGVCSSQFGLTVGTEMHSILPERRKCEVEILGADGVADFGLGGYGVRVITLPLYFDGDYADLRKNRESIAAWLITRKEPKKLILGSEPDRYYLAKIYAAVDFENTVDREIGNIQFECNPPWGFLLDGTALTPEQQLWTDCEAKENSFIKEFTASGSMKLVNAGTASVKPIIRLYGNVLSGVKLSCGEQSIEIDCDCRIDALEIDCSQETVTRLSDGENLSEFINGEHSDFFELPSGNCEISVVSSGLGEWTDSLTVIVGFEPQIGG